MNHMYRDSLGNVTTGIGCLIDPRHHATDFAWYRSDGAVASRAEVHAEWDRVKNRTGPAQLHTTQDEINRVFDARAGRFEGNLRAIFTDWPRYPGDAQMGMLVHAWACGTGKLRSTWHNYTAACHARDWETAAREAPWRTIRTCRRDAIQRMFRNAATVEGWVRAHRPIDASVVVFPGTAAPLGTPTGATDPWATRRPQPDPGI